MTDSLERIIKATEKSIAEDKQFIEYHKGCSDLDSIMELTRKNVSLAESIVARLRDETTE